MRIQCGTLDVSKISTMTEKQYLSQFSDKKMLRCFKGTNREFKEYLKNMIDSERVN